MIKNGFAWSEEKSAQRKHLRFINTTVMYAPKGLTFGKLIKLVKDKKTQSHKNWVKHKKTTSGELT